MVQHSRLDHTIQLAVCKALAGTVFVNWSVKPSLTLVQEAFINHPVMP